MSLGTIVQGILKECKKFRAVVDPPYIVATYLQRHLKKCALTSPRGNLLSGTTVGLSTVLNHGNALVDLWRVQLASGVIAYPDECEPKSPRNYLVRDIIMNHSKREYTINASNCL